MTDVSRIINQIAKRVNATNNVYAEDIWQIKRQLCLYNTYKQCLNIIYRGGAMKEKIVQEYEGNGYKIHILKPDITKEEREKENFKIAQKMKDSVVTLRRVC